jgi:hypothetical protein
MRRGIRVSPVLLFLALLLAGAAAAADKSLAASGTISKLQAAEHTIVVTLVNGSEMRFVWNADTRIIGTLTPGAKVAIRYTPRSDGQNLAYQISVVR